MKQPREPSQVKFNDNKVLFNVKPVKSNFTLQMAETFGEWLAAKRRAAGLNQTELAERSRVTKATISLYEKDKVVQPRLKQLDKIGKVLGISSAEIREAAASFQIDRPRNAPELLQALERLGVEGILFDGAIDDLSEDEYQEILENVRMAVELALRRRGRK